MDGAARTAVVAAPGATRKATFREVFAVAEFRALWLAQLLSLAGDQLARLAMTVLVYDRTHSALWTAVTYAVTFLPWVIGGLALSGLADRLPRREVMVTCDVARLVLVCLMALVSLKAPPQAALWIMVALLFLVTLLDSPFKSARSALMADILSGEHYVIGTAVTQTTIQVGMVVGLRAGRPGRRVPRRAAGAYWSTPRRSPLRHCLFDAAYGSARRPWPGPGPGATLRLGRPQALSGWCSATAGCGPSCCSAGSCPSIWCP